MNVFLIETESNHFANQLFSSWVHKNLPGWNILRVGSDGDDIIEQVQVALTKNISKVIHLGRPTTGAIIQMTMAFSMGMPGVCPWLAGRQAGCRFPGDTGRLELRSRRL